MRTYIRLFQSDDCEAKGCRIRTRSLYQIHGGIVRACTPAHAQQAEDEHQRAHCRGETAVSSLREALAAARGRPGARGAAPVRGCGVGAEGAMLLLPAGAGSNGLARGTAAVGLLCGPPVRDSGRVRDGRGGAGCPPAAEDKEMSDEPEEVREVIQDIKPRGYTRKVTVRKVKCPVCGTEFESVSPRAEVLQAGMPDGGLGPAQSAEPAGPAAAVPAGEPAAAEGGRRG